MSRSQIFTVFAWITCQTTLPSEMTWPTLRTCPNLRLGFILDHLALCWPILAYMLCDIGLYWGYVGTTLRLLGCHDQMLAHLGAHAGPSWPYVGTIFCDLGLLRAILGLCCFFWIVMGLCWPIKAPSWGYVGPSWAYVGPSWRHLGAMLGPPGPYIGPTLSHLGSVLANPAPSWNCLNARTNKTPLKTRLEARLSRYLRCFLHISVLRPHTSKTTKTAKFGSRAGKSYFLHQLDSF